MPIFKTGIEIPPKPFNLRTRESQNTNGSKTGKSVTALKSKQRMRLIVLQMRHAALALMAMAHRARLFSVLSMKTT